MRYIFLQQYHTHMRYDMMVYRVLGSSTSPEAPDHRAWRLPWSARHRAMTHPDNIHGDYKMVFRDPNGIDITEPMIDYYNGDRTLTTEFSGECVGKSGEEARMKWWWSSSNVDPADTLEESYFKARQHRICLHLRKY